MTTTTLTLAAFLEARLAEDEAAALGGISGQADPENGWGYEGRALTPHVGIIHEAIQAAHIIRWHPARVLAEVAAKRAILANERAARAACGSAPLSERLAASDGPTAAYWRGQAWVLRHLAAAYSDHPDYDESWRP